MRVLSPKGKFVNPVEISGLACICWAWVTWQHTCSTTGFRCLFLRLLADLWSLFCDERIAAAHASYLLNCGGNPFCVPWFQEVVLLKLWWCWPSSVPGQIVPPHTAAVAFLCTVAWQAAVGWQTGIVYLAAQSGFPHVPHVQMASPWQHRGCVRGAVRKAYCTERPQSKEENCTVVAVT